MVCAAHRARFLLPKRDGVEHHRHHRSSLNYPDQAVRIKGGAQYLADNPPAAAQPPVYNPEPTQTYQPQPVYEPAPAQTFENPAPTQVSTPMVQEPAPTPASQALANLLDDLDL